MDIILIILLGVVLVAFIFFVLFILSKMKGKIDIQLNKNQFTQGEEVKGKIILDLKEPLEAKALKVGIIGIQKQRNYTNRGVSTSKRVVYEFYQEIDSKKIYPQGRSEYDFSLRIPIDLINKINNPIERAIEGVVSVLTGRYNGQIKWYISAFLDIKGFNIENKVQILIY